MSTRRAPNVRARQLGIELRRLREAAGLSAEAVADKIGASQAKITRIELAQTGVSKGDLILLLSTYGVPSELHEQYWELARAGREPGWWHRYRDVLSAALTTYIALEAEATRLHQWSWGIVPGLLQTEGYARAMFAADPQWRSSPDEVDRLVSARMARQERLRSGEVTLWAVIDESLLHRPIGGPTVIAGQLARLAEHSPGVTVQILPSRVPWHAGLHGAFTVMHFDDHPQVTFAESLAGDTYIERPDDVARYTLAFDHLRASAASLEESRALILGAQAEWKDSS